jgi:PAS domain S-box-containing protein
MDKVKLRQETGILEKYRLIIRFLLFMALISPESIAKQPSKGTMTAQESQRWQFLLSASPAVIFTCEPTGDYAISFASDNVFRLVGYTPAEFMADPNFWAQQLHPEDAPQIFETLPKIFELGIISYEYRFLTRSGYYKWIQAELRLVCDVQGVPVEIVGYLADVSDRKAAEAQLAHATRLKDEFIANMSHELRTPLTAILGMAEALQEEVFGPIQPLQRQSLETIESSGTHLLALINDLLDFSHIEADRLELNCTPIEVVSLCYSCLGSIEQQSQQKNIQIATRLPVDLPNALVDERRIRQVLIDLLNNAIKFTPFGGNITLEILAPAQLGIKDYLQIVVIDTGIGIAAQDIHKLFQPFSQLDSALDRQYEGTGLGLAFVKRIVELHGGEVSVSSEVGVGSCFGLTLPCAETSDRPKG